jgi:hypothetical protein
VRERLPPVAVTKLLTGFTWLRSDQLARYRRSEVGREGAGHVVVRHERGLDAVLVE